MSLECRLAVADDFAAVGRMLELYQYELSDIWDQDLDARGEYGYNLEEQVLAERFFAHVALVEGRYAGFALVAPAMVTQTDGHWKDIAGCSWHETSRPAIHHRNGTTFVGD